MRPTFLLTLSLALLFSIPLCAHAATTPTEAAAIAAANHDHTAYALPPGKLLKARAVSRVDIALTFGSPLLSVAALFLILQFGIAARMRNVAVNLSRNHWAQGFIFFFEFLLLLSVLSLPIDIYAHHVSMTYGLSIQHWAGWFGDQAKAFALAYIFGGLGVMLLFFLIRKFPRHWWLWLWFPTMAFLILSVFADPYIIAPMFNKFEPLAKTNPELVTQLERVVARGKGIEIPPERMFLMKASDKVTTLNAYVSGFGASKRIVVWDTSISKGTPDEILFIFGHEMGHYVLGHIVRGIAFSFLFILIAFFLGFHLSQWLIKKFGKQWRIRGQEDWAALAVFVLVLTVINFLAEPLESAVSRTQEHAADVYGQEVVHGIIADPQATGQAAFQLLGETSLDDPYPPALVEFWTGSHPPLWFRAAFAKHYDPWGPNAQPKYFSK